MSKAESKFLPKARKDSSAKAKAAGKMGTEGKKHLFHGGFDPKAKLNKKKKLRGSAAQMNKMNKMNKAVPFKKKPKKTALEADEIQRLKARLDKLPEVEDAALKNFASFPISVHTLKGLKEAGFKTPTDIQKESLKASLTGRDVLGAAKTGSGKTLAFLIPVLEKLFSERWTKADGMGALVLSPTRELAQQTFETLNKVGKYHDFSAGLVIGGTNHTREAKLIATCNIVICTPGRLLQHMDSAPDFDANNLQVLVLDEADRCLELSFADQMNAIIENLPSERQTLLFSATQTRSVRDLARLSLRDPVAVSPDENSTKATPDNLDESYVVCPLENKFDMLWSFLKMKKRKRVIVFVSSCKQARYLCEALRRVRVPTVVWGLFGTLKQHTRMAVFKSFCDADHGALIATDLASRGLDFPTVDWVLQLDCPKDWQDYQHRVGRTARNQTAGQGLLVLQPSEEEHFIKQLRAHRITPKKEEVNPRNLMSVQRKLESYLASDEELKRQAERAFSAYLRTIFLMKNKLVFDVTALDTKAFAASLGMATAPKVKFLKGAEIKKKQDSESTSKEEQEEATTSEKKKKKTTILDLSDDSDDEDDDSMLTVKRKNHKLEGEQSGEDEEESDGEATAMPAPMLPVSKKVVTKAALARKVLKKNIQANQKFKFDEDGEAVSEAPTHFVSEEGKKYEREADGDASGINLEAAKKILRAEDAFDRKSHRERVKEKHKEEKRKEKDARRRARMVQEGRDPDEEEEEEYTSDSEDDGPNLDWLPDPDKVYGKRSSSEEEGGSGDDGGDSSEPEEKEEGEASSSSRKRPNKSPVKRKPSKKPRSDDNDDGYGLGVGGDDLKNLGADEDLALKLLLG